MTLTPEQAVTRMEVLLKDMEGLQGIYFNIHTNKLDIFVDSSELARELTEDLKQNNIQLFNVYAAKRRSK